MAGLADGDHHASGRRRSTGVARTRKRRFHYGGRSRPARGAAPRSRGLSIAYLAKPGQTLIVPAGNERECALITLRPGYKDCRVAAISTLEEVVEFFAGKRKLENVLHQKIQFEPVIPKAVDFGRIHGQAKAKRAAVIAAAGGHNLLMVGPPGEGKSMLASAMVGICPTFPTRRRSS